MYGLSLCREEEGLILIEVLLLIVIYDSRVRINLDVFRDRKGGSELEEGMMYSSLDTVSQLA